MEYFLNSIQEAVITFDRGWRYTYVNRSALELSGKTAGELLGRELWDVFPEAIGTTFHAELHRAAAEKVHRRFEEHFPSVNRWLEADAYPSEDGVILIVRDVSEARQRDLQARNSEQRLRLALSCGRMGVWEYDLESRKVQWSPEVEALHGIPSGTFDATPEHILGLLPVEERSHFAAAFRQAVEQNGMLSHEFSVQWPDGSVHWLYCRGQVLANEASRSARMLGITMDITAQKNAGRELQKKYAQLQELFSLAETVSRARGSAEIYNAAVFALMRAVEADRASVLIFDPDGVLRFKAWAGLSDEYRAAVEGHTPWQRGARDAQPITVANAAEDPHFEAYRQVFAREGIGALAFIPLAGNQGLLGKFMLYYNGPHEFQIEELQVAQAIATHVAFAAERQQGEEALRDSERQLRFALEAGTMGAWEWDIKASRVSWSPTLEAIHGLKPGSFAGTFEAVIAEVHPEDRAAVQAAVATALQDGSRYCAEYRMLHPDGTIHWVEGKGQVLYDAEGKPERMLGVCADITQRKQTEEAVRQSHKLESLGVLAGGIAHDFNNLLTGVIGGTSLALEAIGPEDLTSDLLKNVLEAGERAATLTRQLLAYAGKGQFVIEPIDVSDLILQSRELLSQAVPKKVQLRLQPARNLPLVHADRSQLQQLLLNLVINGAEAIGDDRIGTVEVHTAVVEVRRAEGGRSTEVPTELGAGEHVVITVTDSGCGMDEATLARAFDPFFSTKFTGRGLGLSAVQGIVRGMKGAIQVQSTPGRGSVFTVFLPAASQRSRFVAETPRTAQKRPGSAVLVIDDESVVRETARCALERAGYTVTLADDGAEAVRLFRASAGEFDLVLLDLTMPLMSGQETLESLRAIRADVPVILSSGYSEDEASRRVGGRKLAGFLQKPYTAARLCRMLEHVLGAAGTSAAKGSLD